MRLISPSILLLSGFLFLFENPSSLAAGHAFDENFSVMVEANPSQEAAQLVAEYVLKRANQLRSEIADEWLGSEIPLGFGRTAITVHFQPGAEGALTWAKDRPGRTLHDVYLRTTPDRVGQAIEEMLPHEMVHVVLATQYPERLPVWVEEGIASRYDDAQRIAIRQETVAWWTQSNNWPQLTSLFGTKNLHANDTSGYTAAASLVDFLLTRGDKKTLLAFEADLRNSEQAANWDAALRTHYQIHDATGLQNQWQSWVRQSGRVAMQLHSSSEKLASLSR